MKTNNYYKVIIVCIILGFTHLTCSTSKVIDQDYYLNVGFINKEFNNTSLGVLTEDIDPDTINVNDIQTEFISRFYFLKDFRKQFPLAITYFSKFNNLRWVYYNPKQLNNSEPYSYIDQNGVEKYFDLPYSKEHLRNETNFDYLMYFESITIYETDNSKKIALKTEYKKYNTVLTAKYVIWDNKNLVLVTKNQISVTSEMDNLPSQRSYKNIIMKLTAMIIDDLPMFKK